MLKARVPNERDEMHRKSSPTVTPEMADQIRLLQAQCLYHQIAALLEINQGRVSEVVTGPKS